MSGDASISNESTTTELSSSSASDVGSVRRVNEDSFLAAAPIYFVADGMGGHNAGDKASQTVLSTFAAAFPAGLPASAQAILDAIDESNLAVRSIPHDDGIGTAISGTTLAGVALVEAGDTLHWMVFNIGDSRVYSWDGRALSQLSVDHSAVQELVDAGLISAEQAAVHPDRNIITRAIGAHETVEADVWLLPVGGVQAFLMCSDGLTKEIDDDRIASILALHGTDDPAVSVAQALVDAALAAGGRDNVTAVFVEADSSGVVVDGETTIERDRRATAFLEDTRPRN